MTSPFAGRRRNEDLGRSVDVRGGLFLFGRTHRRQRVPLGRRGGERRQRASSITRTRREGTACRSRLTGDTSFTRSRDPCTSIVAQLSRGNPGPAQAGQGNLQRSRGGAVIAVGQTRATGRNRQRGGHVGRSAARRVSPLRKEVVSDASEKEGGRGLRPCEDLESSGRSARTS